MQGNSKLAELRLYMQERTKPREAANGKRAISRAEADEWTFALSRIEGILRDERESSRQERNLLITLCNIVKEVGVGTRRNPADIVRELKELVVTVNRGPNCDIGFLDTYLQYLMRKRRNANVRAAVTNKAQLKENELRELSAMYCKSAQDLHATGQHEDAAGLAQMALVFSQQADAISELRALVERPTR